MLPVAALQLRQGFGRLIRSHADRGVAAILDPRLHTRRYGARLLEELPPCRRVDDRAEVEAFFAEDALALAG
jgi:ATP-dependent DNA helicase DinG